MKVKICGLTNKEDALNAISLGADAIGFIFAKNSPRTVTPEIVEGISPFLPPFVSLVGVFVDQPVEEVKDIMSRCRLDLAQLHGNESPAECMAIGRRVIKAFQVSEPEDLAAIAAYQGLVSAMLLDTKIADLKGGTGQAFDWGLAISAKENDIPLILAGGINSDNIKKAVKMVNPYALDISSGVESEPGKKDYNKMQDIIALAKSN